jgi:hypothetical protein
LTEFDERTQITAAASFWMNLLQLTLFQTTNVLNVNKWNSFNSFVLKCKRTFWLTDFKKFFISWFLIIKTTVSNSIWVEVGKIIIIWGRVDLTLFLAILYVSSNWMCHFVFASFKYRLM